MYTSTEDARSDLFLSGAVYVIGPVVFQILLFDLLNLDVIPGMDIVLALLLPIATTALVPLLLMRYRNESLGQFGYGAGLPPNFGVGMLLALPIIAASVLAATVAVGDPLAGLGVSVLLTGGLDGVLLLLIRVIRWLGIGFLAVYATVKARDAFRSDYRTVRDETVRLGRILAAVAAVAVSVALLFSLPGSGGLFAASGSLALFALILVLVPLGVAGSLALLLRMLRGPSATSAATMLTPVVLLALGPFRIAFDGTEFALGVWRAAVFAGIGLIIAGLQESRRSAVATLGLTLAIALFTASEVTGL